MGQSLDAASAFDAARLCPDCHLIVSDRRRRFCPACNASLSDLVTASPVTRIVQGDATQFQAALLRTVDVPEARGRTPAVTDIIAGSTKTSTIRRKWPRILIVAALALTIIAGISSLTIAWRRSDASVRQKKVALKGATDKIATLEQTISRLGNEKAQLEDRLRESEQLGKYAASVAGLASRTAVEMKQCVNAWGEVAVAAANGYGIYEALGYAEPICNRANASLHELGRVLDEFLG